MHNSITEETPEQRLKCLGSASSQMEYVLKRTYGCTYWIRIEQWSENFEKELASMLEGFESHANRQPEQWTCFSCGGHSCSEAYDNPDTIVCDSCGLIVPDPE